MSRPLAAALALLTAPALAAEDGGAPLALEAFAPVEMGGLDGGPGLAVEAFTPAAEPGPPLDAFAPLAAGPTVRSWGWVAGAGALDTRFDSPRGAPLAENVLEGRLRAAVGLDAKLSERVRVVLEARAQVRGAAQRELDRAKGFFEPTLGDAYLDLYAPHVDVRLGHQRVPLGANVALAPADALNPRDLRESLVAGELEDALLPVFAVRAQGEVGAVGWLAVYAPFFTPHRAFVFGQDEALLQPGLGLAVDTRRVDPSVEDFVQDRVLETERPPPFLGDVALRVQRAGRVKVGASWVWMNEKLPRVRMDGELAAVLAAQAAGRPVDQAAALSVVNRLQAGEVLYRGSYARTHLFSLEASALLGPGQLDVDVTFSPRQTFVGADLSPVDKAAVTWVVGFSQASDSPLVYSVSYLGLAVPGVGAQEQLLLLEPATAVGGARTGVFHVLLGTVAWRVWQERLELSLRAAFEPIQRSFGLGPRVTWRAREGLQLYLAAEVSQGAAWSPFGYFDRNDRVLVGARYDAP